MKSKKLIIFLIIIGVIVGIGLFISKSNNKPPASIANSPEKLCIDNLTSKSKPPTFEEYPISEIYTGEPATLDQNSSFIAKRFRSYFTEALKGGSNFAGHYAVGQWGFTGIGREMGIVDIKTGKVYVLPYVAEIEFSYRKDSNLLIVDPIESICSYMGEVPDDMNFLEYMSDIGSGSGRILSEVHPYYFLWQNGTFKLLNPQDGQPSMDNDHLTFVPELIKQLYSAEVPNFGAYTDDLVRLKAGERKEYKLNGEYVGSIYLDNDSKSYVVADFNNDGLKDVAIVIGSDGGGSGYFYHLTIFMNESGHLKYLTSQEIGDRIEVNKISYNSGIIIADIITQGKGEPFCCGTTPATLKLKLQNGLLFPIDIFTGNYIDYNN